MDESIRKYLRSESVVFGKTQEPWGGLSNMAAGYPIEIDGVTYRTAEHLYQACKFPYDWFVQQEIVACASPMAAKVVARTYPHLVRDQWRDERVMVMRWCLRCKLLCNWATFGALLLETGDDRPIVEYSAKDSFWGAAGGATLSGTNTLGRLLMELRQTLRHDRYALMEVHPPPLTYFLLFNRFTGSYRLGGITSVEAEFLDTLTVPERRNNVHV